MSLRATRNLVELDGNSTSSILKPIKSFGSKREALTQSVIYVYCPKERELEIGAIVEDYSFDIVINDYELDDLSCKVICHFESASLSKEQRQFLVKATELGAWVEPLVSYLDSRLGYTEVRLLHSGYFLHQKAFSILSTQRTQLIKRIVDLLASLILGVLTLPIGLFTALAIKIESSGPVFYKQKRTGQYNQEFYVVKFRSMRNDAEKSGAKWAAKNDERITKVGSFIRKTRIDELPQIINILNGDMSIVGPRPEREVFITELEKEIPYYRFRHAVKPGVTGLAQVSYPYGSSVNDAVWKHKFDIYYIKHHSIWLDIKILLKTVRVVLFGMGR
ncbi:exopolysaccharide biosynthesis polyprenyl glycosylphosphotransferase [Shewanella algae]|uniref:exopolysaccharide biosynthesis polyprenyl glycosylphosphotransferase n=1 Tax=Shewanella algae TaxID=38313 RepID=UPI001AAC6BA8|nr:exopolysaccharide biosynthesis polyprenyl glycosylphosphotransferase [Shewanella algae]MBO2564623.1 exopolysaccharide biosynthesis polyprenyl glycosylphosphotransferase [Shewanella algae]MBO2611443.1 exopolysaccharide biosynthesis polyprenyl glycosylphosphotransferase [Shewanella algae]UZD59934.1 exopolysaccharide biosynthesis polyprenyl glycosylphosphotransferase [Shewanella algae]